MVNILHLFPQTLIYRYQTCLPEWRFCRIFTRNVDMCLLTSFHRNVLWIRFDPFILISTSYIVKEKNNIYWSFFSKVKQTNIVVSGEDGTLVLLQCLNGGVVDTDNNICTCENGFTGNYCETGLYFLQIPSVDEWHCGYDLPSGQYYWYFG